MQKWEYCVLSNHIETKGLFGSSIRQFVVSFYRPDGEHTNQVLLEIPSDSKSFDKVFNNAFGQVIAQLGEQGWEVISVSDSPYTTWYFKRLKEQ
jgi:hypothetical protein